MAEAPDPSHAEDQITPFGEFLHQQRKGAMHADLSEGLHRLIEAVQRVNKPGDLTLKVTVRPQTGGGLVLVTDQVAIHAPEPAREAAVWFVDRRHNLRRTNPDQPDLPIHELRRPDREETTDDRD